MNKMKKSSMQCLVAAAAMTGMISSCSNEQLVGGVLSEAEAQTVRLTFTAPDAIGETTRAASDRTNSAKGGITNVDMEQYDIRYILEVYPYSNDTVSTTPLVKQQVKSYDTYQPATFEMQLTPGQKYRVVAWADFVEQGSTDDLHYNTANLQKITFVEGQEAGWLNDESRDAYFASEDLELGTSQIDANLVLRRPFAKVRVVTTDWDLAGVTKANNFKITYYGCERFSDLNLLTGESSSTKLAADESTVYTGEIDPENRRYALGFEKESPQNRTLTVDYLLVKPQQTHTPIHFKFEALADDAVLRSHDFATDIPIERNWLTTITGNMMSVTSSVTVTIDETFENDNVDYDLVQYYYGNSSAYSKRDGFEQIASVEPIIEDGAYLIHTAKELAWISEHAATIEHNVKLMADIDLNHIYWSPINIVRAANTNLTFDGNGYMIRNIELNGFQDVDLVSVNAVATVDESVADQYGFFGDLNYVDVKDLTLENVTIVGATVTAGGLCGVAQNGTIEGCEVRHVFIREGGYTKAVRDTKIESHPIGGLVGMATEMTITGCRVLDADLQSTGIVGGVVGSAMKGSVTSTEVELAELWKVLYLDEDYTEPDELPSKYAFGALYLEAVWIDMSNQVGSIVGVRLTSTEMKDSEKTAITSCKASDIEYKYSKFRDLTSLFRLTQDVVPTTNNAEYTYTYGSETYHVGPSDKYYGF